MQYPRNEQLLQHRRRPPISVVTLSYSGLPKPSSPAKMEPEGGMCLWFTPEVNLAAAEHA